MTIETAKNILLNLMINQDELTQEAIRTILAEIDKPIPKIEIIDDKHQRYCGLTFHFDKNDGHYKCTLPLHKFVCMQNNINVPDGYDVHHIDENKVNNDISNLQVMTKAEHKSLHNRTIKCIINCLYCGKEIETAQIRRKFCNDNCRMKYYHLNGYRHSTPITGKCLYCGKEFHTHQKNRKYCSRNCAGKARYQREKGTDKDHFFKSEEEIEQKICLPKH